jgi:hypothetical protein
MEVSPVSGPVPPVQSGPAPEPQPPETEPQATEEETKGTANGVVRKLNEGGHFNPVADLRLRINHFDNPNLERTEPPPGGEDVPGNAYEKFLEQYKALYEASQPTVEPGQPAAETEAPQDPVAETPPPQTETAVPQEPVTVAPPESELPLVPDNTEPPAPANDSQAVLQAFVELLKSQNSDKNPNGLDITI